MNKLFFLVLAFLFVAPYVLATDIAYIVKDAPDANVINVIDSLNYSYDLIDDSQIPSTDFSNYKMILVWDEILQNADKIPIGQKNALVANTYYLKTWKIAQYAGSETSSGGISVRVLINNSITQGFPSSFQVYNSPYIDLHYLPYKPRRAPGLQNVVSTDNSNQYPVVGVIDANSGLFVNGTAKARIAFFGITETDYWTSQSTELFKRTLDWIITNWAPVCIQIPDFEWNEDETAVLNLNDYCSDSDGDTLFFYIYDTSTSDAIAVDSFENGILNLSSKKDWNGEDWIKFKISDGKNYTLTSNVTLRVLAVNDAPILKESIKDISWNEDVNLTNYLNLNKYFSDVDSQLNYSVSGNHFIHIEINNGLASFSPDKDWFGTENIIFSATDGEFSVNSNAVVLSINALNEPPEFLEMNCSKEILEDTEEECQLLASDFENDSFSFSVVKETNLKCHINQGSLSYISKKDYNGLASCVIRVSDVDGYTDYLLEANILPVNDAPYIQDYSPQGSPRILNNTDQEFNINAFDVDSNASIFWFLDENQVCSGPTYTFNQDKGNYNLLALVSDGEFNASQFWNIFVGEISNFKCSEVNGYVCSEKETCSGRILGVYDTPNCCSIPCSLKFEDIDRCENISDKIEIKIESPDENEKFTIGDAINVKLQIKNRADDQDFDVEAYLYDLTEDEVVESSDASVSIDKNDKENVELSIKIPEDISEKDDYAVFAKVADEYCNEKYVKIKIEREKYKLSIEDVELNPAAVCGEDLTATIKLKNLGSRDENLAVKIENSELGISQKSDSFKLEKYDKKDEAVKILQFNIPEETDSGNYTLKVTASSENTEENYEKEFTVNCPSIQQKTALSVDSENLSNKPVEVKTNKSGFLVLSITTLIIALIIIYLFYLVLGKKPSKRRAK